MTIHMMYQSSWFQSLSLKTTAGRKLTPALCSACRHRQSFQGGQGGQDAPVSLLSTQVEVADHQVEEMQVADLLADHQCLPINIYFRFRFYVINPDQTHDERFSFEYVPSLKYHRQRN